MRTGAAVLLASLLLPAFAAAADEPALDGGAPADASPPAMSHDMAQMDMSDMSGMAGMDMAHMDHAHMHHHHALPNAQHWDLMASPDGCGPELYWSFAMSMCLGRPVERGHVSGMLMASIFGADVGVSGARHAHELASTNWLMLNGGVDVATWNRLDLDVMLTAERWTLPESGWPLPLQIGEENAHGVPFVDAQHPHSSPIMGLQLTDVMALSTTKTRLVRVWFAPRGESTDGPIAFMHRATGTVNPDAPLGHHIGQDVGHISSTVIGASLTLERLQLEVSTFHGREPQPDAVDLPVGTPDSVAARLSGQLGPHYTLAASFAYVHAPEGAGEPTVLRMSASGYGRWDLPHGWRAHATFVFGGITHYDGVTFLPSLLGEVLFTDWSNRVWGRMELLERTAAELEVPTTAALAFVPLWVGAVTLGYTRKIVSAGPLDFWVGGSGTLDGLPDRFAGAYGGHVVVSGKIFLEARLMQMFDWRRH